MKLLTHTTALSWALAVCLSCGCQPAAPPSVTPAPPAQDATPQDAAASPGDATAPTSPQHDVPSSKPLIDLPAPDVDGADAATTATDGSAAAAQIAAAQRLASDLGVVIQEDADGRVIGLDTAARRSWVDDFQLREILVFPHLQSLTIEGPSISHVVAPDIAQLSALSSLAMRNTLMTNDGLTELKSLAALRVIDLRLSPLLDDSAMETLAEMPQLRAVRLLGMNITDRGVSALLRLPNLVELDVRNCRGITQSGFQQIAAQPSLRTLKIGGMAVDDAVLRVVGTMHQLRGLSVDNCAITDDGIAQLDGMPLVELTVYQCTNVTDNGLRILASLTDLQRLTLRDVPARGAALMHLPHPEKLVELNLAQSGLTDQEVAYLPRLTRLESLTLSETAITDAAVDTLVQLTSLKRLSLSQTRLTDTGMARLAAALPQCTIRAL